MRLTCIAVVDQSGTFAGPREALLRRIVQAVQVQVERDFAPAWGFAPLPVLLVGEGQPVPIGAGLVRLVSRVSGHGPALGSHDVDQAGYCVGQVGVDAIALLGGTLFTGPDSVSSTLSHEVLEMIANPSLNLWANAADGESFAREVCDPVSGDSYGIELAPESGNTPWEEISVSNFVHPAWFAPNAPSGSWFDQMQLVHSPFEVRPTGYAVRQNKDGSFRSHTERSCVRSSRLPLVSGTGSAMV